MRLRSLVKDLQNQNWIAVALDFFIVVVGILLALQITNWNEARTLDSHEKELLIELKREIQNDIIIAESLVHHFENLHVAAKRSITFMDNGASCGDQCWPVLADFFHASHWFQVAIKRSTFDEMRRQGLPRSRNVIKSVENYHAQNYVNSMILAELPKYREVLRSIVPIAVHEAYWATCWSLEAGIETINYHDCPSSVSNDVAAQAVHAILQHKDIRPSLTFWFSEITPTAGELNNQNASAKRAISAIDTELALL